MYNTKVKNRECNYEILRIVCAFAVIFIHMSGIYVNEIISCSTLNVMYTKHIWVISLYNIIPRFAVPCFMMLTGAFCLCNEKNANFLYFYRKSFVNIGIPTIIFSIAYLFYKEKEMIIKVVRFDEEVGVILLPIKDLLYGSPYYHMWYLYTLMGVYLLIPVIIYMKKKLVKLVMEEYRG